MMSKSCYLCDGAIQRDCPACDGTGRLSDDAPDNLTESEWIYWEKFSREGEKL